MEFFVLCRFGTTLLRPAWDWAASDRCIRGCFQDLTALAKELRAVDDVRPPHKVTDYSSSSDDSGTTDEEDDEEVDQEPGDESTSGAEDSRAG